LHAALHNAALQPPYVLAGHSMGGPYVRVFAALYPDEVSGIVLIDPTQVNACESMEEIKNWFGAHCPQDWKAVRAACDQSPETLHGLNWMRALEAKRIEKFLATVPESRREALRQEWLEQLTARSITHTSTAPVPVVRDEFQAATESFRQAIAANPLPKVPIFLLAASNSESASEIANQLDPNVRLLQDQVRGWHLQDYRTWIGSTPGAKLIVGHGQGHNIQVTDPDLVIRTVREIVDEQIKGTR